MSIVTTLCVHVSVLSLLCCDYYDMSAVTTATILSSDYCKYVVVDTMVISIMIYGY